MKEFVPYKESLELKELGFDEPCFAKYDFKKSLNPIRWNMVWCENTLVDEIYAPTYSAVFRWFREKYKQSHIWMMDKLLDTGEYTYEEAELACLDKLAEIVESKI